MTEDEMVGWHHQLNGHGFGWTPGDREGQGSLACCISWGCKELDTTYQLNNSNNCIGVPFHPPKRDCVLFNLNIQIVWHVVGTG